MWESENWKAPIIEEGYNPDRTILNLSFEKEFADEFVDKFVVSENHRKILELMRKNPNISAKDISEHIKMSPRGVQKNIDTMKKEGLIERIGSPKGGYWIVK